MQEVMLSDIYDLPCEQMGTMSLLSIDKALIDDNSFSVVMKVGDVHLNTQGTGHGGILFTLCDQAVGAYLVCNKVKAVGVDGNIYYYRPANNDEILTATAYERKSGQKQVYILWSSGIKMIS